MNVKLLEGINDLLAELIHSHNRLFPDFVSFSASVKFLSSRATEDSITIENKIRDRKRRNA